MGAAVANRDKGIVSLTFAPDGDMMYAPACCGPRRITTFRS
jgi:hypothetical protein